MFDGFQAGTIDTGEGRLFARWSGNGDPLLLLHGFPENHLMWRDVAPVLAERFTVICADLRGYGQSGCPPSTDNHAPYSKRRMAKDCVGLMRGLGFGRFMVAGHDRGGRVAYRLALDHPETVTRLAVLDVIPIATAWALADARLALNFWPWSLLAQPAPLPERLIAGAPEAVIDDAISQWGSVPSSFPEVVRADYVAALGNADHVHAICEEFRAAATIDRLHDEEDLAADRRIQCPLLALWDAEGALAKWYQDKGGPLEIWRRYALDVSGHPVSGGHFFPEQHPKETAATLAEFFVAG